MPFRMLVELLGGQIFVEKMPLQCSSDYLATRPLTRDELIELVLLHESASWLYSG